MNSKNPLVHGAGWGLALGALVLGGPDGLPILACFCMLHLIELNTRN